ncbi:MAG: hypothetical protein ACLUD1_05850 [Clostridia bacterium]
MGASNTVVTPKVIADIIQTESVSSDPWKEMEMLRLMRTLSYRCGGAGRACVSTCFMAKENLHHRCI